MSPHDDGRDLPRPDGTLGPNERARLGKQLQAMYAPVVASPLDDRLAELVRRLGGDA